MNVIVREYARLTYATVHTPTMDEQQISISAFDWLCAESARLRGNGANLVQIDGMRWLRLDNYVGVIETPCNTRIEVLPKTIEGEWSIEGARKLLRRMLASCLNLPPRKSSDASIHAFDGPLTEWVIAEFLEGLRFLVKRGVRFQYRSVQEEQSFLRGRLEMAKQLRQPLSRQHVFQVEHDIFDADRPENRLLRSALDRVCKTTRDPANWRLSRELSVMFSDVPASSDIANDFSQWRSDRLLAHYKAVRPLTSLILSAQTPLATLGIWRGPSLLFPMERIFERYVESCLRRELPRDVELKTQLRRQHLAQHQDEPWFELMPDFHLSRGNDVWILDTKWKRLAQSKMNAREKYDLSQGDFYQLFAYGQKYQGGVGDLFLVYPKTEAFNTCLKRFQFTDDSTLWVVPFDLETGRLCEDGWDGERLPPWREA